MIKFNFFTLAAVLIVAFLMMAGCSAGPVETAKPAQPESQPALTTDLPPAANSPASQESQTAPLALDGKSLAQERCTVCHSFTRIESKQKSPEEWASTVQRMVSKGAVLNPDEQTAVINYLSSTFK